MLEERAVRRALLIDLPKYGLILPVLNKCAILAVVEEVGEGNE